MKEHGPGSLKKSYFMKGYINQFLHEIYSFENNRVKIYFFAKNANCRRSHIICVVKKTERSNFLVKNSLRNSK